MDWVIRFAGVGQSWDDEWNCTAPPTGANSNLLCADNDGESEWRSVSIIPGSCCNLWPREMRSMQLKWSIVKDSRCLFKVAGNLCFVNESSVLRVKAADASSWHKPATTHYVATRIWFIHHLWTRKRVVFHPQRSIHTKTPGRVLAPITSQPCLPSCPLHLSKRCSAF